MKGAAQAAPFFLVRAMNSPRRLVLASFLISAVLAGCGSKESSTQKAAAKSAPTVEIRPGPNVQEELQIEEMAGVLSIPVSTVKSRLYRGLEALRGALEGGAA